MGRHDSSSEEDERVRARDRRRKERSPDDDNEGRRSKMEREESRRGRVSGEEEEDKSSRGDRRGRGREFGDEDDGSRKMKRDGRERDDGERRDRERSPRDVRDRRDRGRSRRDNVRADTSSDDEEERWPRRERRERPPSSDEDDDGERRRINKDGGNEVMERESRRKDQVRADTPSSAEEEERKMSKDAEERERIRKVHRGSDDEEGELKGDRKMETEEIEDGDERRERNRSPRNREKHDREKSRRGRVRADTPSDEEDDRRKRGRERRERQGKRRDDEDEEGEIRRDRKEREYMRRVADEVKRDRREKDMADGDRRSGRDSERDSDKRLRDEKERRHKDRYDDQKVNERKERKEDGRSSRKREGRDGAREEDSKPKGQGQEANAIDNTVALGRSGGVYIPPFKLARMMKEVQDKSSVEYQRLTWDALRKSINGLVNKVNASNIKNIIPELFAENLIRGRGLFCRSCMKSQMASPGFTDVFAALVAVVNTKFPEVGDLLLRRIVLQLKRAYKRNDKPQLLAAVKFIAHLVNQQVAHEIIALELLTVLLENPTDDSVEVAVGFVTESGAMLQDLSPKGLHGIFERFRGILHEGEIDKRVQFLIEGLFAIRKAKFQGHPAVRPELDLVEPEDQLTHEISLQDEINPEIALDIFKPDPDFIESEKKYEDLKKSILGDESEDEDGSDDDGSGDEEDEEEESDEEDEEAMKIKDETETNLVNLRRTIYLTIMSSVDFEEAGHKLLKIKLEPGQEMELCIMLLECCSQERTYLRYYGLLGQRFCMINKIHQENFEKCFVQQYSMIHRLETNKLRNVAKFFAHLLGTDALPWHVLAYIRLTEEDTTSSSRIFIKILFQELSEHLGIRLLNERLQDPTMQDSFESIFPKDNPKNTRFSINFFTSIGLGGITENLREYLKNMPRLIMQQQKQEASESESDSESESGSSSGSSGSESDTESSSSESERDDRKRKRRRRG
ncbi:PREDICTED: pre-mRNA-splicing factor CWC22 homolog [Tarenaya hassleriana]|uniref:pre-mRNA-splicing factor CWC22 homolog n=1 Tax=Tarenaya hassleriana TaxID=28532 RepID=UPI00053C1946|nr:PREDICTED: pre-mRNA-splicing factor CWC22 homolog [Tarenaya hassleriana]